MLTSSGAVRHHHLPLLPARSAWTPLHPETCWLLSEDWALANHMTSWMLSYHSTGSSRWPQLKSDRQQGNIKSVMRTLADISSCSVRGERKSDYLTSNCICEILSMKSTWFTALETSATAENSVLSKSESQQFCFYQSSFNWYLVNIPNLRKKKSVKIKLLAGHGSIYL